MAVGQTIDEGLLRLDQTLGELIPERIPVGEDPRTASVAAVQLAEGYLSGSMGESVSDPTLAAPAALARYDGCLLVVNSQIDGLESQPVLPFTVSGVPVPATILDIPSAAGRC